MNLKRYLATLGLATALTIGAAGNAFAQEMTLVEPETVVEETGPVDMADPGELYLLAHLLCGEVQTGSWETQIAVGSVVLNRVADSSYPNTLRGVIYQKGQYACTWDGNFDRTPTERNWAVARYLLENGSQIPANVVYQAQFRQGHGVYGKFGREILCYK